MNPIQEDFDDNDSSYTSVSQAEEKKIAKIRPVNQVSPFNSKEKLTNDAFVEAMTELKSQSELPHPTEFQNEFEATRSELLQTRQNLSMKHIDETVKECLKAAHRSEKVFGSGSSDLSKQAAAAGYMKNTLEEFDSFLGIVDEIFDLEPTNSKM